MDLKTINEQPDGFGPPDVTVTIARVWDQKSGTNDTGDWSFQNVDVEQNGTKATLKLKNLPKFPDTRIGESVTIRAHKSDTHGLTGLKTETRDYNGKTYKSLVVTPSARWEWAEPTKNGSNGNSAPVTQAGPVAGVKDDTVYADHILACAELANVVTASLGITDPSATQACFATICIDSKNRNILLPAPKTLAVSTDEDPYAEGPDTSLDPPEGFIDEEPPF